MTYAVHLVVDWFGPGATLWRAGDYPEMSEDLIPLLPSSATVSDGEFMVPVKKFLETGEGKKLAEKYKPEDEGGEVKPDYAKAPGSASTAAQSVAANGESESPSSPRSSGPETQALPGQEVKTGNLVTASGSKPEEKAVEKAAEPKK